MAILHSNTPHTTIKWLSVHVCSTVIYMSLRHLHKKSMRLFECLFLYVVNRWGLCTYMTCQTRSAWKCPNNSFLYTFLVVSIPSQFDTTTTTTTTINSDHQQKCGVNSTTCLALFIVIDIQICMAVTSEMSFSSSTQRTSLQLCLKAIWKWEGGSKQ